MIDRVFEGAANAEPVHLNPHIDYGSPSGPQAEIERLLDPEEIRGLRRDRLEDRVHRLEPPVEDRAFLRHGGIPEAQPLHELPVEPRTSSFVGFFTVIARPTMSMGEWTSTEYMCLGSRRSKRTSS